ncbi:hypothetical protein AAG570_002630 [Ranatra chinensis]|uniref:Uncharacterized protein n=1 Tax=Ranatra chinensis TaxID=642074 RepID=A0ABD0YQV1_9HEMI
MASKRRNKKQETTEIDTCNFPSFSELYVYVASANPHARLKRLNLKRKYGLLRQLLNRNSKLSIENKLTIYKTILKHTWTYEDQSLTRDGRLNPKVSPEHPARVLPLVLLDQSGCSRILLVSAGIAGPVVLPQIQKFFEESATIHMVLKPTWTYGIELWGTAKEGNIDRIPEFPYRSQCPPGGLVTGKISPVPVVTPPTAEASIDRPSSFSQCFANPLRQCGDSVLTKEVAPTLEAEDYGNCLLGKKDRSGSERVWMKQLHLLSSGMPTDEDGDVHPKLGTWNPSCKVLEENSIF